MAYSGRKAEFTASEGILQSPLGERETEPTLGPSGIHERLNCCAKKRRMNTFSHLSTVSASYVPSKVSRAMRRSFSAEKPRRTK